MLKKLIVATLYTALSLTAIPLAAQDFSQIEALRDGTMKKLRFHDSPKNTSDEPYIDALGAEKRLGELSGQITIVNFWATWCGPCRKEMPTINALAEAFSDQGVVVLPIATGRNPDAAIRRFFEKEQITFLNTALDPTERLTRDSGVFGLPVTIVLDPNGREIARLTGDADWYSESARNIVSELTELYQSDLEGLSEPSQ